MQLKDIYRDIYSRLNQEDIGNEIFSLDIIKSINHNIQTIRTEYIKNGLGHYFSVSEIVEDFEPDDIYSFLQRGSLSNEIISDVPIVLGILSSEISLVNDVLLDENQSWDEGDVVLFGNSIYEAIRNINNENTYGLVFNNEKLRTYFPNNGLKYKEGDLVYNYSDEKYYKVLSTFIAKDGQEDLEEVVWRRIGNAFVDADHYPLNELKRILLHSGKKQAFSVVGDLVYVNSDVNSLSISYIPKWEYVDDLDAEINLPDQIIPEVVRLSVNQLLNKLRGRPSENPLAVPNE